MVSAEIAVRFRFAYLEKFFETNFKGVMPLEIVVDTKKKRGVVNLNNLERIDSLSQFLVSMPDIARPLSITDADPLRSTTVSSAKPGQPVRLPVSRHSRQ